MRKNWLASLWSGQGRAEDRPARASLSDVIALHRRVEDNDSENWSLCGCGQRFTPPGMQTDHYRASIAGWLDDNRFGDPVGYLTPGTSCLRCGAVVGLPDRHLRTCPGR